LKRGVIKKNKLETIKALLNI